MVFTLETKKRTKTNRTDKNDFFFVCVNFFRNTKKWGENSFYPCRVPENSQTLDYFFTLI